MRNLWQSCLDNCISLSIIIFTCTIFCIWWWINIWINFMILQLTLNQSSLLLDAVLFSYVQYNLTKCIHTYLALYLTTFTNQFLHHTTDMEIFQYLKQITLFHLESKSSKDHTQQNKFIGKCNIDTLPKCRILWLI